MNKERVLQLADYLEKLAPKSFSMFTFTHDCGTPSCIAGHANDLFSTCENLGNMDAFADVLELMPMEAHRIALPGRNEGTEIMAINPYNATPTQAAKLLRYFAKTGVVDWPRAMS